MSDHLKWNKNSRILKSKEIVEVIKAGKKLDGPKLRITICDEKNKRTRFGIIIARAITGAVVRNRYKRLIREVIRMNMQNIAFGKRIILYLKNPIRPADYIAMERDIIAILKHGNLYTSKKIAS